jgi:tRNA threonylcarbamoyladenosine biosynthesis protein TsaB
MIDYLFKTIQIDINDIDYIACANGPGSFTGLRIGIATAKGLAHSLGKKIIPVPTLDALAYNVFDTCKIIVPIIDARRSHVYTSIYKWQGGVPVPIVPCCAKDIDILIQDLASFESPAIFCGDGTILHKNKIIDAGHKIAPTSLIMQKASSVGSLAFHILSQGDILTYSSFKPFYLKVTQAEREYEEKNK